MKPILFCVFFTLSCSKAISQPCGSQFSTGIYHNAPSVYNGDSINIVDVNGYYQGLHIYSSSEVIQLNDVSGYTTGTYRDGIPIGNWKEHCSDGSYSIGEYQAGEESKLDENGKYISKKQGIYSKIGVWQYFDKENTLLKTEKYERTFNRKGWTNKTFLKDSSGAFVLIEFKTKNRRSISSPLNRSIYKEFSPRGIPYYSYEVSFWKNVTKSYDRSGALMTQVVQKKFLGRASKFKVTKEFNEQGVLIKKSKQRIPPPVIII